MCAAAAEATLCSVFVETRELEQRARHSLETAAEF